MSRNKFRFMTGKYNLICRIFSIIISNVISFKFQGTIGTIPVKYIIPRIVVDKPFYLKAKKNLLNFIKIIIFQG